MKVDGIRQLILASILWTACLPSNTEGVNIQACDTSMKKAGQPNLRLELLSLQCWLLAELLTDGGTAAPGALQGERLILPPKHCLCHCIKWMQNPCPLASVLCRGKRREDLQAESLLVMVMWHRAGAVSCKNPWALSPVFSCHFSGLLCTPVIYIALEYMCHSLSVVSPLLLHSLNEQQLEGGVNYPTYSKMLMQMWVDKPAKIMSVFLILSLHHFSVPLKNFAKNQTISDRIKSQEYFA